MAADDRDTDGAAGRSIAKLIAGTAVVYIVIQLLAAQYGWSHRMMVLFDLAALAVFGYALWITWKLWRTRRADEES